MSLHTPSKEQLLKLAIDIFRREFDGRLPTHAGCAPGRVNLIGEHTDYNDGYVFPMALPNVTILVGSKNGTDIINIYSDGAPNEANKVSFSTTQLERGNPNWANYVKGVVNFFEGAPVPGFDAVIVTSVPVGAGLSSSAAIEVATFTFLEALNGIKIDKKMKVFACQKAEHVFAEMPCGIMDQFISVFGEEGNALLLDCQNLNYTLTPFGDENICVLITNSNMKHKLDGSEYPLRRSQCQEAARILEVKSLRETTLQNLEKNRYKMSDGMIKRARHVITEISRTFEAAQALRLKDYSSFGLLMLQSHQSLRDDFEVSTCELNQLVDIAMSCNGVYGSRLTGAGFGGSTVTLVNSKDVNQVIETLKGNSKQKLGFSVAKPSKGAENLTSLMHEVLQMCSLSNKKSITTQTKSLVK